MKTLVILALATICLVLLFVWSLPTTGVTQATTPYAITQLTNDHAVAVRPAWSPDNRMIAYQSNRAGGSFHIYLMNADGSNQHALTSGSTDDRHPIWMPDGKSLLFDSFDGARREIWRVNIANGNLKQVTRMGGLANFGAPSPDGQRLSFYLFKNEALNLWTAGIDGADAKPLTTNLASANSNQCTFACHHAGWSPDGRTIAYSAGELDSIWTVASDGSNSRLVVDNGEDNHFPWFLPDGRLAFVTEHIQPAGQAWTDAWAYDLTSGQRTLLHGQMAMQGPFEWSNDGTKVLFHSPRAGNFDIYMIDLSAEGGVNALRGNPILPEQVKKPDPSNAPTGLAVQGGMGIMPLLIVAGLISVTAIAGIGLFVWIKARKA